MTRVRLFVYGTLKRRGDYHSELRGARFLGEAETAPGHVLSRMGDYLALTPAPAGGVVKGELFEVPTSLLPALDEFEGDAYTRQNLRVKPVGTRAWVNALAYFRKPR